MLFWQNKKHMQLIAFLDLILVAISFVTVYWLKKYVHSPLQGLNSDPNYYQLLVILVLASYFSFNFLEVHKTLHLGSVFNKLTRIWSAILLSVGILVVALYLLHVQNVSRLLLGSHFIVASTLISIHYLFLRRLTSHNRGHQTRDLNVLVIGSRERARETVAAMQDSTDKLINIVGCLDINKEFIGKRVSGDISVIGDMSDFSKILLNKVIDEVIFALPLKQIPNVHQHISFAEKLGVKIRIMPDWQIQTIMFRPETASIAFEDFNGIPCIALSSTPKQDMGLLIKGIIDFCGSALGLLILSPLFLAIAAIIKLSSKGPIFFSQERVGVNGRRFQVLKFRTMVVNAEALRKDLEAANEMDGPVFKIKNDPRITSIGNFLRRTSLDELPQLFNVLKGDMSLVGPRPPLPAEVEKYLPSQRRRLSMKPGITCIWQVSGRNSISFEQWMKLDLKYIDNWSLLLDIKLLLLTMRTVVGGTGH
ncbi:MAG: sugar transferase [Desulfobulbaceae bacterium]|nr:sugar transferase [Desulfobulbaceae bacterium]